MIKIENAEVFGWEVAIRGMRNPMNSWEKSDSRWCINVAECSKTSICDLCGCYEYGKEDLTLMKKLCNAGTDHRKFMRMITVYVDVTAPLYWWSEFDTYKVGTVSNSCSKMHKLLSKPFELNDFSFDRQTGYRNEVKQFRPIIDEQMVAKEKWINYVKDYEVSNYGRVKHVFKNHYRILSGSLHQDGYVFVTIYGKQMPVHRLVAKLFISDDYDERLVVNHKDGNKQNNFVDNLEWCTQKENVEHSINNHLQPKINNTYKGKFTEEQRNEIKSLWDNGIMSIREIAKRYNVSHTCIYDIINDKYKYFESVNTFNELCRPLVDSLNELRDLYFREEDTEKKKQIWYAILQMLPVSYNQKRTLMLNYEVLTNIYKSRKDHKLDEWKDFCKWIETLPYSELITMKEG